MAKYMDHPSKQLIREAWCRPFLAFMREKLRKKLVYLGLPSKEANDVLCWLEHINYVIAFQCRNYPKPSSVNQARTELDKLEEKLLELERQKKIEGFALYDGYIEEVLIRGKDTIGQVFELADVVTLFNLDFCNSIIHPIRYHDADAIVQQAYKSDALRKLLEAQRDMCRGRVGKFVMFLTVHSSFIVSEQERWVREQGDYDIKQYLQAIAGVSPGRHLEVRRLKAYVFQFVRDFFRTTGFSCEWLPAVNYLGAGGNWLVHFTILGTTSANPSGIATCYQEPLAYLQESFWEVRDNRFDQVAVAGLEESEPANDLVAAFERSRLYQEVWQHDDSIS